MSRPVAIRKIIIDLNINHLDYLRESLKHYRQYLQGVKSLDLEIPLSKGAIKRRIRYLDTFIEDLDIGQDLNSEPLEKTL